MPGLRETLEQLARLAPDRFKLIAETKGTPETRPDAVYSIAEGGVRHFLSIDPPTPGTLPYLTAALIELIDSRGWGLTVDKSYLGWQIDIYERLGEDDDAPMPLGEADSKTEPFALVLAQAVVKALEP